MPASILPIEALHLTDNFGKVTLERTWRWDTRVHPMHDYDLFYAWSGEGSVNLNGKPYAVSKGSCFLFRPGDIFLANHNPAKCMTVSFLHFTATHPGDAMPGAYRKMQDTLLFEAYFSRYMQTLNSRSYQFESEAKLLLSLMLQLLFREDWEAAHTFSGKPVSRAGAIREAANYVKQYPGLQHRITDLAERAKLSPRYFSVKFKEIMWRYDRAVHHPKPDRTGGASSALQRHERNRSGGGARILEHLFF